MLKPIPPKKIITDSQHEVIFDYHLIEEDDVGKTICIEIGYSSDDTCVYLKSPPKEIENPDYEQQLATYNKALKKYEKFHKERNDSEYQEYLKLKEKFEK
jgi:hypothetical protein